MLRIVAIVVALALGAGEFQRLSAQEAEKPKTGAGGGLGALRGGAGKDLGGTGAAAGTGSNVAAEKPDFACILKKPIKFDFNETPLTDVAEYFANHFDINIQLDSKGLADAGLDPSAPVTRALRKPISFSSALHLILDEVDLTFVVQDEVLLITSREKADEVLTTVVYPVGDLLGQHRQLARATSKQWGPLMSLITNTIQPDSWDENGGPGSISPFGPGNSLAISQKMDVHEELEQLFSQLRAELPEQAGAEMVSSEPTTEVYKLGAAEPNEITTAIQQLIAPTSWQDQGGAGKILVVTTMIVPPDAKGEKHSPDLHALIVQQTADVHEAIQSLLDEMGVIPATGAPGARGMGGMGGGMGGMGGGMFRVGSAIEKKTDAAQTSRAAQSTNQN